MRHLATEDGYELLDKRFNIVNKNKQCKKPVRRFAHILTAGWFNLVAVELAVK